VAGKARARHLGASRENAGRHWGGKSVFLGSWDGVAELDLDRGDVARSALLFDAITSVTHALMSENRMLQAGTFARVSTQTFSRSPGTSSSTRTRAPT
jgi:hypothetical protein